MRFKETTTIIEKDAQGNIVKETKTTIEREYNYWTNPYTPSQPYTNPLTNPNWTMYPQITCGTDSVS